MGARVLPSRIWCRTAALHTAAMHRRLLLLACASTLALPGCQSRAMGEASTRTTQQTMASPLPVVQPRHTADSPRYQQYDQQ